MILQALQSGTKAVLMQIQIINMLHDSDQSSLISSQLGIILPRYRPFTEPWNCKYTLNFFFFLVSFLKNARQAKNIKRFGF